MLERFFRTIPYLVILAILAAGCSTDSAEDPYLNLSANRKSTGASATDLLTDKAFDRIVFDFVYVEGHSPGVNSINNLISFAEDRCYKPDGVTYTLTEIPETGKTSYTTEDILDMEEAYRTGYNKGNDLAVFVLVLDGGSAKNEGNAVIMGTAYRNTSFVIYEETIQSYSSSFLSDDKTVLESTVLNHEFSHLLGLVNLGTSLVSDHEDPDHAHHCKEAECLMNYQTDAGIDMTRVRFGGGVPGLDAQCLADLRALGGK